MQSKAQMLVLYVSIPLAIVGGVLFCTLRSAGQQNPQPPTVTEQTVGDLRASGAKAVKHASEFAWIEAPSEDLTSAGTHTLQLAHCPPGVFGNETEYWVYLVDGTNSEPAKVTGGSCKGDGLAGTLNITTARGHARGYRVTSASSGLQEASLAARWSQQLPPDSRDGGKVIAPPGEFRIFAPLSFLTRNQTIDFSGSTFECWVADDACMRVGSAKNYNLTLNVTLINPRGRPTQLHGRHPMIEVYGQKTRIINLLTMNGVKLPGQTVWPTFASYVSVVADQAFLLDGLDTTAGTAIECTRDFCGSVIVAPGPFHNPSNAAVGWIKNAQISMQCTGNGIDWQSGNSLRISDSVVQGYNQFGLRGGTAKGGYATIMMENIYMEDASTCKNPIGNVGAAGVLMQGSKVSFRGGEGPMGHVPQFAKTGSTRYEYFVVAQHAKFGKSNPLYAGFALTNGSGDITITTPDVAGAASFDLLRVPYVGGKMEAPNGKGDLLVAANVPRASACSNGLCTFTDPQKSLSSYQVVSPPTYFPKLDYWPGALVLGSSGDSDSMLSSATAILSQLNGYGLPSETNTAGATMPAVIAEQCLSWQGSPIWMSCFTAAVSPYVIYPQNALLLASKPNGDGGLSPNLKGRINLSSAGSAPGHFITLVDSNFPKTLASWTNRPTNDPNDTYIGYDQGNAPDAMGLSVGAPASISSYIANDGDGKAWKERLTAKNKTFAVPVVIENGNSLTVGGGTPISQMKVYNASAGSVAVPAQSCADAKGTANGLSAGEQIAGVTPPKALGNLTLNAYAGGANVIVLHFCNPSTAGVNSPAGAYGFLGIR